MGTAEGNNVGWGEGSGLGTCVGTPEENNVGVGVWAWGLAQAWVQQKKIM